MSYDPATGMEIDEKDRHLLTVGAPATGGAADRPAVASVLTIIGWLDIIGGFVCAYAFWPGSAPVGYEWQTVKYATPLTWLSIGIVSGSFSLAIAEGLTYLARIADRLDRLGQPRSTKAGGFKLPPIE